MSESDSGRSALRCLFVEENREMAAAVQDALAPAGLKCDYAADVRSGLEHFKQRAPHLVLLSLGLPRIGGAVLCPAIRAESTVPIAILSVRTRKEDHLHALNLGADDFIVVRPLDPTLMMARLLTLLRRVYQYDRHAPHDFNRQAAPMLNLPQTPASVPANWVTCEACGYMGPQHRFEKLDARGQKVALCPHCNQAQNLRFNLA